jgi:hypothetical protein
MSFVDFDPELPSVAVGRTGLRTVSSSLSSGLAVGFDCNRQVTQDNRVDASEFAAEEMGPPTTS